MKYWLRGGLISLGIFVTIIGLSIILPSNDLGNVFYWILFFAGFPAFILARLIPVGIGFGSLYNFFVMIIPYSFALGSLAGWIVEKVKAKGQNNSAL